MADADGTTAVAGAGAEAKGGGSADAFRLPGPALNKTKCLRVAACMM